MIKKHINHVKIKINNMNHYFEIANEDIKRANIESLHSFCVVAFSCSILFAIFTKIVLPVWEPSIYHYIFMVIALVYMLLSTYLKNKESVSTVTEIVMCNSAQVILMIFLSIFDTMLWPNANQIFVSLLLMSGSILFIIPFFNMLFGQTVCLIFFEIMAFHFKPFEVAKRDFIATVLSYIIGLVVYSVVMEIRVRESLEKNAYRISSEKDALTGIDNRASSNKKIKSKLHLKKDGEYCALFVIDVDNFKTINDTLGHSKGDEVLVSIANILSDMFRKTDVVGRYGGDEFIAFMKDFESVEFVKRKCENIERQMKFVLDGRFDVSCSIGVCVVYNEISDMEKMFKIADNALYGAKEFRKGKYVINEYNNKRIKDELPIMVVVDDNQMARDVVAVQFEEDYQVVKFENGMDALDFINENAEKTAIVLLDMLMPEMNGIDVLKKIRGNKKTNRIPVIAVSSDEMTEEEALEYGADDMVTKPLTPAVIRLRVQNVCRKARH